MWGGAEGIWENHYTFLSILLWSQNCYKKNKSLIKKGKKEILTSTWGKYRVEQGQIYVLNFPKDPQYLFCK